MESDSSYINFNNISVIHNYMQNIITYYPQDDIRNEKKHRETCKKNRLKRKKKR